MDLIGIDPTTGAFSGRFVMVGGTGAPAGLHGEGTFQGQGTTGTYTSKVVFS